MILCLDIGNSHIYAGILDNQHVLATFRCTTRASTKDELGIFLKNAIAANGYNVDDIQHISMCSVVPHLDYSVRAACIKYFDKEPFILSPNSNTGLTIDVETPQEVGSDRLANAIAATQLHPNTHLVVLDFGTATTFCVIDKNNHYLGGPILPGMRSSMRALTSFTAKLPEVEIKQMQSIEGRSTIQAIQAGLYYSKLGAVKEILAQIRQHYFADESLKVIATGGFAHLFQDHHVFDEMQPNLVLQGLAGALDLN